MLRILYLYPRQALVLAILAAGLLSLLGPLPFFLPYLLLFLLVLLTLVVLQRYPRSLEKRYFDHCDPEPYLAFFQAYLRRPGLSPDALANARLSITAALCDLGRYPEAQAQLELLDPGALPPYPRLAYWHDSLYLRLRRDPRAPAALSPLLAQAEAAARELPQPMPQAQRTLLHDRLLLRFLEEGASPDLEAQLTSLLSQAENQLSRVHYHLTLAQCALSLGDRPAAQEHLNYILTHGNKLHARTQAAELWAQQGFPPSTEPPA